MSKVHSYRWQRDGGDGGICFCVVRDGTCLTSYFQGRVDEAADADIVLTDFTPCPDLKHFRVRHIVQWGEEGPFEERLWPSYHRSREACEERWNASVSNPKSVIVSFEILDD